MKGLILHRLTMAPQAMLLLFLLANPRISAKPAFYLALYRDIK